MFGQMLESGGVGRREARHPGWAIGSTTIHAALIAFGIAATMRATGPVIERERVQPLLVYREPPRLDEPRATHAPRDAGRLAPWIRAAIVAPAIPLPAIGFSRLDDPLPTAPMTTEPWGGSPSTEGTPGSASRDRIFRGAHVDRAVVAHRGNGQPRYPAALRGASIEGEVLVRFVVDTLGRVEAGSIEIVRDSHALFGVAVVEWLGRNRYSAAEATGRRVRQLVEQRINFTLTDPPRE
ncbi:MAG: TonB family protein [Gemmatimonadaceae bacterium]